jgi:hypothetical protein
MANKSSMRRTLSVAIGTSPGKQLRPCAPDHGLQT